MAWHAGDARVVELAVRAPSAHNAQPWRLAPLADGASYELHYDAADYLPYDPEDRDAGLGMGAFYESIVLAANLEQRPVTFTPRFERNGSDLLVGTVTLHPPHEGTPADPLAPFLERRSTNRSRYTRQPVPQPLVDDLQALGCVFCPPKQVAGLIRQASRDSWTSRRFVSDLQAWVRFEEGAPDGMTPRVLGLTRVDRIGLRLAFRLGRLPPWLVPVYSARDVRLATAAPAVAVLTAPDMTLPSIFDAGRRLLRAWLTVTAAGLAYHPWSIVIDEDRTRPLLATVVGTVPMAMFRIGYPSSTLPRSGRRPAQTFLRAPTGGE